MPRTRGVRLLFASQRTSLFRQQLAVWRANEGRDHNAKAWSLALAGGPIRGAHVVGRTSEDGTTVVERPLNAQDIMASIGHAVGIDKDHVNYTKNGRPISVVDEKGKLVPELFA